MNHIDDSMQRGSRALFRIMLSGNSIVVESACVRHLSTSGGFVALLGMFDRV
jgi:hypothetical protein